MCYIFHEMDIKSNASLKCRTWTKKTLEIMHYDRTGSYITLHFLQASRLKLLTHCLCLIINERQTAIGIFVLNTKFKENQANRHYSHSAFPYLASIDYSAILIARKKAVSEMCCFPSDSAWTEECWMIFSITTYWIDTLFIAAVVISLVLRLREPGDKRIKSAVHHTRS